MLVAPFSPDDSTSFSQYKPLQNVHFLKVGNIQFFFLQKLCSHNDRILGEKFEDMFLVKLANKGTFFRPFKISRFKSTSHTQKRGKNY